MGDYAVNLLPAQVLPERPFTDPAHTALDRAVLEAILADLRARLRHPAGLPAGPRPLVLHESQADGRRRRVVIGDLAALLDRQPVTVVGFFGERRPGVDRAPLDAIDEELIAGFPDYPGVLGYFSAEQPRGNWANLVLLRGPQDLDHWSTSPRHAFAAKAMAPDYYRHIRLHNGRLAGGVLSPAEIEVERTKYYDFEETPAWRAVRDPAAG